MNIHLPASALPGAVSRKAETTPLSKPAPTLKNESFHHTLAELNAKPDPDSPAKVADVAKQFEALMIGQVLKAARASSDGGWLDDGSDDTNDISLDLAEQSLSQAMAARGTFGIAKMITQSLENRQQATAASSAPATSGPLPLHTDSPR
jgi:Rod binding domain-containing protein